LQRKTITVIGCGSWGGTIAQVLTEYHHTVTVWHKFPDELETMKRTRQHVLLPNLIFSPEITFTDSLEQATRNAELVVIAVPSHVVRPLMVELGPTIPRQAIIVNLAKGIENDTLMTMSQVIAAVGGVDAERIVTLYGPSHAEEVSRQIPTTLVSASKALETAKFVQHIFSSPLLRVYTNDDILGVELGGSLKNVIAIAAGICDGIGYGDNTKAALLTRGMTEITRLGVIMGARRETFAGLSGIGDLIATCLSRHSRNRYVGEEIGKGKKLSQILDGMEMVAEGVKTTKSVKQLSEKYNVEMPISNAVYEVLFEDKDPIKAVRELMTRNLVHEQEESLSSNS
jgi:glycerol-3-phosphate dehydrogenase (NAD(P)+)